MKRHSVGFALGLVAAFILGFGAVAGIWFGLNSSGGLGYEPGVLQATKTGPGSASLSLETFPDSHVCHANSGEQKVNWVTYCPTTTFELPPNSVITVTIKNYDSSTTLINDYFSHVHGTIGGIELVNNKPVNQLSADGIAHTFTVQSVPDVPNQYPIFVSVPLAGVANNAPTPVTINGNSYPEPNVMTFQFRTGPPGTYIWHCYDPCGDSALGRGAPYGFSGPMSTTGFMAGKITVTNY
jgi:hypothetical protein